jgi:hypothetical protein
MKQLQKEINLTKNKLIKKAKKSGLFENFGDKEFRSLQEKYCLEIAKDYRLYMMLTEFSTWCGELGLEDLK